MKFSKAYEPNQYEPDIYALWEKSGAFKPGLNREEKGDQHPYSIVMPPPNANGNLHIGHGLTIALEDILTRFHRLNGENTWYIPGADHAGFETWVVYERLLEKQGKTRFDYSRDKLYNQVWDFVHEQRGNMELQLRSLGASCDWDSLTFALDQKVVDVVYETFKKLWDDGLIYRGKKLVNFCTKHQTAFADIEVTHKDEAGKLWRIAYPLEEPTEKFKELIVSTTRPETLFGDTAVAVNPTDPRYKSLIGKKVKLPLTDRLIPIIADEHADPEYGTGVVKITPAHDPNDFEVGQRHDLEQVTVIGFDGKMTDAAGPKYAGMTTDAARKQVLEDLIEQDLARGEEDIIHSVGHCYKCDTTIEPLLREQWFVNVEPLAKRAIEAIEANRIKFYPASKQKALIHYFENLHDWNISRQIPWGIPIPAFQNIDDPNDWIFDTQVDQTEIKRDGKTYRRDEDTFDTWFSSSQWPFITTSDSPIHYPVSVMETGADLLFPWVSRMIMLGLYVTDDVPFREVYMHGMVLDEKGQKMSKSKGNVINPIEIVNQYGSDALRLGLIASRSAGVNQAFSTSKVIASRNLCNKLWNISRLVQQIVDENPADAQLELKNYGENWICYQLNQANKSLQKLLKQYRFAEAGDLLYDLIWNKYADWFLESQKLWKNVPLLKNTLEQILIMLHPFAPFVTETIWQNLSWTSGMLINQRWPQTVKVDSERVRDFEDLIAIVTNIRSHFQNIPGANQYPVAFHDDDLVSNNQLLIQHLTKAPSVPEVTPDDISGLHLAIAGHPYIYLQIPASLHAKYRANLEDRILKLGQEITTLESRLSNQNYLAKAPAELVKESSEQLHAKQRLIEDMKAELNDI